MKKFAKRSVNLVGATMTAFSACQIISKVDNSKDIHPFWKGMIESGTFIGFSIIFWGFYSEYIKL